MSVGTPMKILEETPYRLHIEFWEECSSQGCLGVCMGALALLMVLVAVMDFSARGFFYLLFAGSVSVYALLEKISYGCLIDHGTGQLTLFQRNTFGQTHRLTCPLKEIRTIQVKRRVSGRGRPCSASVTLKSGQQLR